MLKLHYITMQILTSQSIFVSLSNQTLSTVTVKMKWSTVVGYWTGGVGDVGCIILFIMLFWGGGEFGWLAGWFW